MKLQIKKIVALTLITALSAGVLTLAACKGKTQDEEITEPEETIVDDFGEAETLSAAESLQLKAAIEAIPNGAGTPLSQAELDDIMNALPCVTMDWSETESYRPTPDSRFLLSHYVDVKQISLYHFIKYFPGGETDVSDDELRALGWDRNEHYGAILRFPASMIRDTFLRYAGISLDDLEEDYKTVCNYLEETDAFYVEVYDAEIVQFFANSGERFADKIYLYGGLTIGACGPSVLVLRENPAGGYQFVSLLPANW